eukprot:343243-Pelagomonas_calceolata.AAC.1
MVKVVPPHYIVCSWRQHLMWYQPAAGQEAHGAFGRPSLMPRQPAIGSVPLPTESWNKLSILDALCKDCKRSQQQGQAPFLECRGDKRVKCAEAGRGRYKEGSYNKSC